MERQHVISRGRQHVLSVGVIVLATMLAGCGQSPAASKAALGTTARQHVSRTVAAPVVNKQSAVMDITVPAESRGHGAIAMNFKFPTQAYNLLATVDDVAKITVTLKTRSFLLTKTVATAEVLKSQMLVGRAAVQFTGLAAGSYTLDIAASSAAGTNIGTATASATVTDGQTTTVESRLQLVGGGATTAGTTGIGVNLEVVNGQ